MLFRSREMHVKEALEVIDYKNEQRGGRIKDFTILNTPFFTVEKVVVSEEYLDTSEDGFRSYTIVEGSGTVISKEGVIEVQEGDTIYASAGASYKIIGEMVLLKSYV